MGRADSERARRRWFVPALIVAITAALVVGVLLLQPQEPAPVVEESTQLAHPSEVAKPDLSGEEGRESSDLLSEGPAEAPVVMVVFTDFQCPYCARWTVDTLPTLREYVDRGELRIEWRDVNVYGEDSERAARAALAAAMQGQHVEYQEALFAGGEIRSPQELTQQALVDLAAELGLDTEQFVADMDSEDVARTVADNAQQGIDLGAVSTPSFIIDGTPIAGAQPTEIFTGMVDVALAEGGD